MTQTACINTKVIETIETQSYSSLEEASKATGIPEATLKRRCNSSTCSEWKWADEKIARTHRAKKSRSKGHGFELQVIHELTDLGFQGLVSSRSESKNLDDAKIDIAETIDKLPCYIQCKATVNTPNIEEISDSCKRKDRPLVVMWKKQNSKKKQHDYVLMPKDLFYQLLTNMKNIN